MTREAGYSIVELVIASAIMITVSGAVLGLVRDGVAGAPVIEETTDLHQRGRVSTNALAAELRAAAAGTPSGALSNYFASIEPRRLDDPPGSAAATSLTVRYVPAGGAHSRLVQPLEPGVPAAIIDAAGCPAATTACGFVAGTRAVVFDDIGHADFLVVDAIGPGILTVTDAAGGRTVTYPAGAEIAEAVQAAFFVDPATRQLRRQEGTGSLVVADNVVSLTFEYFGNGWTAIPLSAFQDGPFRGAGATIFDADLLGIRGVRASLRLETGDDRLRGRDPRLFTRPGTANGPRVVPDVVVQVDVALRNGG